MIHSTFLGVHCEFGKGSCFPSFQVKPVINRSLNFWLPKCENCSPNVEKLQKSKKELTAQHRLTFPGECVHWKSFNASFQLSPSIFAPFIYLFCEVYYGQPTNRIAFI